jgi:hypothetical protein
MLYLGALAVIGWALAYLRPRWLALRWFLLGCTGLWLAAWVVWYPVRGEHRPLGMMVVSFFLTGFLAEAFASVHKWVGRAPHAALENALAAVSMVATAGAFAAFWAILPLSDSAVGALFHVEPLAGVAIGLASLHGMLALATPSRALARSSILQAAALLTVAVPLTFGRVAITLAWGVLALAVAGLGWRRRNPALRAWAVVLVVLAVGRLFTLDLGDGALRRVIWSVGEQGVPAWLMLAVGVAVVAHGVAWLIASKEDPAAEAASPVGAVMSTVGTVVFFVAFGMQWHGTAVTFAWLVGIVFLLAISRVGGGLAYASQAAAALFLAGLKWVAFDGLSPVVAAWAEPGAMAPVSNSVALAGALLIVLTIWLGRLLKEGESRPLVPVALAVLFFAWLNFEALRAVDALAERVADLPTAKQVVLSVLWGVVGLASVVVGFARHLRPLRYAALVLLGVTLGKILFVDLAQVQPVYRILSFLAVGGLLLCVSFVYHRQGDVKWQKSNVKSGESAA